MNMTLTGEISGNAHTIWLKLPRAITETRVALPVEVGAHTFAVP